MKLPRSCARCAWCAIDGHALRILPAGGSACLVAGDTNRQRQRVLRPGDVDLGACAWCETVHDPAGQAQPGRLYRIVQRAAARRVQERTGSLAWCMPAW